jgi:hypothetical protein
LGRALRAQTAEDCAAELEGVADRFVAFGEAIPLALQGELAAVMALVRRWQALVDEVLQLASDELPDLIQTFDDTFRIRTGSGTMSEEPVRHLELFIRDIPFSPLVARFGVGVGVGVAVIGEVRAILPGCPTLRVDVSPGWPDLPDGTDIDRYRRLVDLAIRSIQPPLTRVKDLFGLNNREVADLFGVKRQAVDQWEKEEDVPPSRRTRLANLLSLGEVLDNKLGPGRLVLEARRPADAYGGQTMLDMVAAGRDDELHDLTGRGKNGQ